MILLDTNVLSAMMRIENEPLVQRWLIGQTKVVLHVPILVYFELQFGIERLPLGRKRQQLEERLTRVFNEFVSDRIVSFDRRAATEAAIVYALPANRRLDKKVIDFQIAGIARATNAPIATRNIRDFGGFGVQLINPWTA